jgi:hypothetical protein
MMDEYHPLWVKNELSWMDFMHNNIDIDDVGNNLHKLFYFAIKLF